MVRSRRPQSLQSSPYSQLEYDADGPPSSHTWSLAYLQLSVQWMPAWKHSQYFLRQPDFLQWHPFMWRPPDSEAPTTLGRKACGLRSSVCWIASLRLSSFSGLLWQPWQLHAKQYCPDAKHSQ